MYLSASESLKFTHPVMRMDGIRGADGKILKGITQTYSFNLAYQFEYNAIRRLEHCIPELKFVGGGCV